MSFVEVNAAFETWLRSQCDVVEKDLVAKHEKMAASPFDFLRATYFRWAGTIEAICPNLALTHPVKTVGDLHVENFGTWRDAEGRLVWGINDFDEAAIIPFAFDLVRLATSARLAPRRRVGHREIAQAILEGYRSGLSQPRPTLLDEHETWMRRFVVCSDKKRAKFWTDIGDDPPPNTSIPAEVQRGLIECLPPDAAVERFSTRQAGVGSLGRPRYLVIGAWRGGRVVREAKAYVPSAWYWTHGDADAPSCFAELSKALFRAPDPFLDVKDGFILRRLAPDARKVEFGYDIDFELHYKLFSAMGFELAALHRHTNLSDPITADLERLHPDWLHRASKDAAKSVEADHREWTVDWTKKRRHAPAK